MDGHTLKAELREEMGSGAVNRLRKTGWVPCVMYGAKIDTQHLKVNLLELIHLLHSLSSEHALIKLHVGSKAEDVMLQSIQYHPYRNEIVHVDFHQVAMDEVISTTVQVEEVGNAKGVVAGGVLEHNIRELTIECLPKDLPDFIEVDVTELEIGDTVYIRDLVAPQGVTILEDDDTPVFSVIAPKAVSEEEELEGGMGASAEPELIRKREKEEE